MRQLFTVLALLALSPLASAQIRWTTDHQAALALARQQQRPVLVAIGDWA